MKRTVILVLGFLVAAGVFAQFPRLPKLPKGLPTKIPGTEKLLHQEPAITTSLNDAVTELPFLDAYAPREALTLMALPRGSSGGFLLHPGVYQMDAQSY